ncbi:mitochondrial import receptor subunit TOM34-like isoform X2 [Heterodontus francisci]|uniref:mitochondrial import receptor subunit TOM34-like isoform X2 n=1 Tax=Heterodontus francisci TaxID=7792 RepID=UPI00355B4791
MSLSQCSRPSPTRLLRTRSSAAREAAPTLAPAPPHRPGLGPGSPDRPPAPLTGLPLPLTGLPPPRPASRSPSPPPAPPHRPPAPLTGLPLPSPASRSPDRPPAPLTGLPLSMSFSSRRPASQATMLQLKSAGNEFFRNGQFGQAAGRYSEAINSLRQSGVKCPEDLSVLYSNRAACYLKIGNCSECIKDCTLSLELVPFMLKPLLRRAAAYEALERYPQAYVDYQTSMQVDSSAKAAQDGMNRMRKVLIDKDGSNWRDNLPPMPSVPLSIQRRWEPSACGNVGTEWMCTSQNAGGTASSSHELERAKSLKEEGNELVRKGEYRKAVEKYSASLKLNNKECTTYTNSLCLLGDPVCVVSAPLGRALCHLYLKQYPEAVQDCTAALGLDRNNLKALYRRAQARKEVKDYNGSISDLREMLKVDLSNSAGQRLLQEVEQLIK